MIKQAEELSELREPRIVAEEIAAISFSIKSPRNSMLYLIVCMLFLSSMGHAQMFVHSCAGEQYSFAAPCNDDFIYLWQASAGNSTDIDKCRFIWTAPDYVTSPTEVTISVLLSNKDSLSCNSRSEIKIIVYPAPVVSLSSPSVYPGPVYKGQNIILMADSTGTFCDSQLIYRWYKDDLLIEGATSSGYTATALGKYMVEMTCSNTGCSNSSIMIVTDSESPKMTCLADKEVCNDPGMNFATIRSLDLGLPMVDDPEAVITNNASEDGRYQVGINNITWTATNAGGKNATCNQKIIIKDCENPMMTCPTDRVVYNDAGQTYATIPLADLGQPMARDLQGAVTVTNNAPENSQYPIGTTTVNWTATDAAGNKAWCNQEMTVRDIQSILELKKTALDGGVQPGEDINYSIELFNHGFIPLGNVTLWDVMPDSVELVSVHPEPTSNYIWYIGTLAPGQCFKVDLRVHVPVVDLRYSMSQSVQGEGFVSVHNDYDTTPGPNSIKNCAYAKADLIGLISSCVESRIVNPGTELKRREFGSGWYGSEELTRISTLNKSIRTATNLSAVYKPSTFSLPQGRSINYGSRWTEESKSKNELTGATTTEKYTSASRIYKERSIELDENGSTMELEVDFDGRGHIGVLKKESPEAHPKSKTAYESSEDYVGSFKIDEYMNEYGAGLVSQKNATGSGYVAVDKRIRGSQGSYESGSGSYRSEEMISTPASFMAKNISLVHAPTSYSYSPSFQVYQDVKWGEGMWSRSGAPAGGIANADSGCSCLSRSNVGGTLISERYSYLDSMQKETRASGLNEMKSNVSFSGQADYTVQYRGENGSSGIENEGHYGGRYAIKRHVLLTGGSKYDTPHLTVTKSGQTKSEWYNGVPATLADYTITITNDGSRALAPVYVRDAFPPGTQYIRSTVKPTALWSNQTNWTLLHLGIGDTIAIGLTLNITEDAPANIVNRIQACGAYEGNYVCAGNYSAVEYDGMTCCPTKVHVLKSAWLDKNDPALVHYGITVFNTAPDSVAVTITDQLPGGMTLLNASISPYTDNAGRIIWVLPEIAPDNSRAIEYTVRANRDGGYSSTVHIDATAINGTNYDTRDAAAYIFVNSTGVAPMTFRYGDWEPPSWNLSCPEGESFWDIIDSFILEVEG